MLKQTNGFLFLFALLAISPVLADTPGFVGNTINSETPSFGLLKFAVSADQTYTDSNGVAGTWAWDAASETLCFHSDAPEPLCGHFDPTKKAGDTWEEAAWDGNGMANLSLNAGTVLTSQ